MPYELIYFLTLFLEMKQTYLLEPQHLMVQSFYINDTFLHQ